jgi:plasmid maintenance system antidote protein VapI
MPTKSNARIIIRDPSWLGPAVHPDTALRLARRFQTTPQVWMHLQADWDLHEALRKGSAA